MKICDGHRTALRLALVLQGLGHKIAASGEELQKRGGSDPCPLNVAEAVLINTCVQNDPEFSVQQAHGLCPFCRGAPEVWIEQAALDMATGPFEKQVRLGNA